MLQDLRFTFRLIRKDRWYAAAAVLALALGIGVNATVFSIFNAAFLRGLPFADADRLHLVSWQPRLADRYPLSLADYQDWSRATASFEELAAFTTVMANLSDDRELPEQVRGAWLTANAFGVLRVPTLRGRGLTDADQRRNAEPVVLLSYRLWKTRYGGDEAILGRTIRLNGKPTTVVGIMPDGVAFPINSQLWMPFVPQKAQEPRDARLLTAFGRLRPGVSRGEASAEADAIAQQIIAAHPAETRELVSARIETFTDRYVSGNARMIFIVMMGAVGFVLLIACANVANLLLSRSAQRAREIAVRTALGATRWRVVRQLLVESTVLGCLGGALGLAIALAAVPTFAAAAEDPGKPHWIEFTVDYVVVAYLAVVCIAAGITAGLAPALHITRTSLNDALKEGGRGSSGGRRARIMSATMVIAELALTCVLLVGAGLLIRSFLHLYTLDLGIDTRGLVAMRVLLTDSRFARPESRVLFFERISTRVAAVSGVDRVAITTSVPPFGSETRTVEVEGRPPQATRSSVAQVIVSSTFFDALGLPILRGRNFSDTDPADAVLVNERAASQLFPGADPLGKRIRLTDRHTQTAKPAAWRTIVGIVASVRHNSPESGAPSAAVYLPLREAPIHVSLLVRSALPAPSVIEAVRHAVRDVDPDQPVYSARSVDEMLELSRWPFRVFGTLFTCFALVALALSSVGLYAVMAYSVTQRTQEIGVRMALGAAPGQVRWLVLRRAIVQIAGGLALGLAGAFALSRVLANMLVAVTPTDPVTFGAIALLLIGVAMTACIVPARRAMRLDPVTALRAE